MHSILILLLLTILFNIIGCGKIANKENEKEIFREKYQKVLTYEKEQKYDKAIRLLRSLLNSISDNNETSAAILYYKIGDNHIELQQYNYAKKIYQEFIIKYPINMEVPRFKAAMAYCSLMEGVYDFAMEEYKTLLNEYPKTEWAALAQLGIANVYAFKKEFEKAIEQYEQVITQYPETGFSSEALVKIAYYTERQGKYKNAIEKYKYAINLLNDEILLAAAYLGIGNCYAKMNLFEEAKSEYEYVIKTYPQTEQAKIAQKKLLKLSN